jgi:hypothetical protein
MTAHDVTITTEVFGEEGPLWGSRCSCGWDSFEVGGWANKADAERESRWHRIDAGENVWPDKVCSCGSARVRPCAMLPSHCDACGGTILSNDDYADWRAS